MSTKPTYEELEQRVKNFERETAQFRRAEKDLRESEERFRMLYEWTPLACHSLDKNGHIVEANQAWFELLGYTRDEVLGKSFGDFLAPERLEYFKENFGRFMAVGEIQGVEYEMLKKDGSAIIASVTGRIGKNIDGSFTQTHCILQDITDHKMVEEDLRLQSEIVGNMVEGVYLIRAGDGTIIYANPKFEKMFGYDPGEMLGKHVSIVNASTEKNSEEMAAEIMGVLLETGEWHGEVRNIKKDGTTFWCYANVSIFDHGQLGRVLVSVHTDITDRKLVAEALQESENRYRLLIETMNESFGVQNAQGEITYVNNKMCEMWGYESEELVGRRVTAFLDDDNKRILQENIELRKKGIKKPYEIVWTVKGGRKIHTIMSPAPLFDVHGNFAGSFAVFTDISELKKHEKQIRQYGEFLNTVVESIPYPFYVIDANNYGIVLANTLTAPGESWKDSTCYSLTHHRESPCDSNEHLCPLEEVKRTGKPVVVEHIHFDQDGDKRNVEVHGYPIFDSQGYLTQMIEYAVDITSRKKLEEERELLIRELQEAWDNVKILRGFLPICASCKKIRDEKGRWNQMEIYIRDRSEAEFSHGICPECARKLYPDLKLDDEE